MWKQYQIPPSLPACLPTPVHLQDKRADHRSILTRSALVSSINSMNLLSLVPPEVKAAYELLTSEFNPLDLCSRLNPLFESIGVRVPMSSSRSACLTLCK